MNLQRVTSLQSEVDIAQLADLFRIMGDPTRLRIILTCLADPTNVGEIATQLNLSPSLVSHHLRLLRAARVLRAERRGKQMFEQRAAIGSSERKRRSI